MAHGQQVTYFGQCLQPISFGGSGIELIIETLFFPLPSTTTPHMAGTSTGLIVRLFTPPIWRVEHGGLIRKEKNQVLFFFSKKREPICPLIAQSTKSVTSNKHNLRHLGSVCSSHLVDPKHDTLFAMSVQSKYSVRFS